MARIYIDFDSTLYNTDKIRNFHKVIAVALAKNTQMSEESAFNEVEEILKSKSKSKVFEVCAELEKLHGLPISCLRQAVDNVVADGDQFVFMDGINFLKKMTQKGHEINILTYTDKEFDYQMRKIMGSGVLEFIDNIIICSQNKGSLALDYQHGIFIDDNPMVIQNLSEAGVSKDRLIRMRRSGTGYSQIDIDNNICTEVSSFDEINFL